MGESRFEDVRRVLVAVSPRRRLMSLLGGLTLSGITSSLLGGTDAQAKKVRASKKKKRSVTLQPGPAGPAGPPGPPGPPVSASCPAGTLFHEGNCIETSRRASTVFTTARTTCVTAGRRLPSLAEMESLRSRPGTDLNNSQEFTIQLWSDNASQLVAMIGQDGGMQFVPTNSSAPFRCVAPAS